jgi:hypothetical protein
MFEPARHVAEGANYLLNYRVNYAKRLIEQQGTGEFDAEYRSKNEPGSVSAQLHIKQELKYEPTDCVLTILAHKSSAWTAPAEIRTDLDFKTTVKLGSITELSVDPGVRENLFAIYPRPHPMPKAAARGDRAATDRAATRPSRVRVFARSDATLTAVACPHRSFRGDGCDGAISSRGSAALLRRCRLRRARSSPTACGASGCR